MRNSTIYLLPYLGQSPRVPDAAYQGSIPIPQIISNIQTQLHRPHNQHNTHCVICRCKMSKLFDSDEIMDDPIMPASQPQLHTRVDEASLNRAFEKQQQRLEDFVKVELDKRLPLAPEMGTASSLSKQVNRLPPVTQNSHTKVWQWDCDAYIIATDIHLNRLLASLVSCRHLTAGANPRMRKPSSHSWKRTTSYSGRLMVFVPHWASLRR